MKRIKEEFLEGLELLETNPTMSIAEAARLSGVGRHTLSKYLKRGVDEYTHHYQNHYYSFDKNEKKALEYYKNNREATFATIERKFGYDSRSFRKKLEVKGLSTKRRYEVSFNRSAFKKITTEEDAYWLGFILADGYLHEGRGALTIKLGAIDRPHLIKFCDYMKCNHDLIREEVGGFNTQVYSVNLNSKELSDNLVSQGISQAKSGKEYPNTRIPKNLKRHYIRGIVDGDGWIRKKHTGVGLVGSKEICSYLLEDLQAENVKVGEHDTIFKVEFRAKNDIQRFVNRYYKDSTIYLDRKMKLAQAVMKNNEELPC